MRRMGDWEGEGKRVTGQVPSHDGSRGGVEYGGLCPGVPILQHGSGRPWGLPHQRAMLSSNGETCATSCAVPWSHVPFPAPNPAAVVSLSVHVLGGSIKVFTAARVGYKTAAPRGNSRRENPKKTQPGWLLVTWNVPLNRRVSDENRRGRGVVGRGRPVPLSVQPTEQVPPAPIDARRPPPRTAKHAAPAPHWPATPHPSRGHTCGDEEGRQSAAGAA